MKTLASNIFLASTLVLGNQIVNAQESDNIPSINEANQVVARNSEFINTILSTRVVDELSDDDRKEKWRNNTERLAKSALPGVKSLRGSVKGLVYPLLNYGGTTVSAGIYRMDENKGYNNQFNHGNSTTNFGLIAEIPLWK